MSEIYKWSRGALEAVECCPACGSSRHDVRIFERRDNERSMPDCWKMVRCTECRSVWLDPRPDVSSLSRAYEGYYTHDMEPDDTPEQGLGGFGWKLICGYMNRRFGMHKYPAIRAGRIVFSLIEPWRLKLDYYGRHLTTRRFPQPGRLLDIGCGNGTFLVRAADMGWRAWGCEVDAKAIRVCRQVGVSVIEGDAFHPLLSDQKFDVVTMSHVIEHVANQQALLHRVYDLLRPGGWFWVALPNPASFGLHVFGAAWHALHPPYHLCIPSQTVLGAWLKGAGFHHIRFLRRGAHVRGVWRISQNIARCEAMCVPSGLELRAYRAVADILATVSPRWADETVVLARRPD